VAGGRIARIFVAETYGVVLGRNTPEEIRSKLSLIDVMDGERYYLPSSLEDETTIIAKALSEVS
jgi:hypothetical protein